MMKKHLQTFYNLLIFRNSYKKSKLQFQVLKKRGTNHLFKFCIEIDYEKRSFFEHQFF